ncbi:hypothetical protein CVT91_03315 [Candidatus Atribacteria bacterium HGW-Atribacteria-1]|nr:MAG: hypothetical protein CVT91_03315 [Candidatus Atribacteria bacterium HGW-Atribacteria-1]
MKKIFLQKPLVSVVILTWNRCSHVLRAIESAYNQPYRPIEVIVVDSASSDGNIEAINKNYPEVLTIRLHKNLGCPEGRNIALANCSGDIIFSLDDDAFLDFSALSLCVKKFQRELNLGVIACQILEPKKASSNNLREHYTYLFCGGACAIKKEVLNKIGYFPSDFFRQAEEGDMVLKILEAGYSILYFPESIVYHEKVAINRNNKLFMFYGCRNELYTVIRRYPLILMPIAVLWKIIVWNWVGIKNLIPHFTLGACFFVLFKIPKLLLQREPVSLSTIKKIIRLRKELKKFR